MQSALWIRVGSLMAGNRVLPAGHQPGRALCLSLLLASGLCVLAASAAAQDVLFRNSFDLPAEGPATAAEASRFLTQATFGPTLIEIDRLQATGYNTWIDMQLAKPAGLHLPFLDARAVAGDDVYHNIRQESWFTRVVTGQDQLRQRVAFALSEILVVSDRGVDDPFAVAHYYDLLVRSAFVNYRTLLRDVTLHPVMGTYLSMRGNQPENLAENLRPDENYAREVMQLFSIGLVRLNPNGTPTTNPPTPTYTQDTIRGFARVFTGWNFEGCPTNEYTWCYPYDEPRQIWWRRPMIAFAGFHQSGAKQLLVYPGVVPSTGIIPGGTATVDLDAALGNIFSHPNVGPFLSRLLIQRLVTSNPSPAYIGRVAAKFANNGSGVRGDMAAVVRAILMDSEARNPASAPANAGKLREPLLRLTQLWRALDARANDGRYREWYPDWWAGQAVLRSPTVFNFFLPNYSLPGEVAQSGLFSPEFQIATDNLLTTGANFLGGAIYYYWRGNPDLSNEDVSVDLARDMPLADTPAALIDRYNLLFMGGTMSAPMRTVLINQLGTLNNGNLTARRRERVQDALWLIFTSPEYVVEK